MISLWAAYALLVGSVVFLGWSLETKVDEIHDSDCILLDLTIGAQALRSDLSADDILTLEQMVGSYIELCDITQEQRLGD